MSNENKCETLAKLFSKVTNGLSGETPVDTIKLVSEEIQKRKDFNAKLETRLRDKGLTEEEIQEKFESEGDSLYEWSEYIKRRFAGEPSVKTWNHQEMIGKGILDLQNIFDTVRRDNEKFDASSGENEETPSDPLDDDEDDLADDEFDDYSDAIEQAYEDRGEELEDLSFEDFLEYVSEFGLGGVDLADFVEDEFEAEEFVEYQKYFKNKASLDESFLGEDYFKKIDNVPLHVIDEDGKSVDMMESMADEIRKLRNASKRMKKLARTGKLTRGRARKKFRMISMDDLKKQAHAKAEKQMKEKYLKGKMSDASIADKARASVWAKNKKSAIDRLAKKLLIKIKKERKERIAKMKQNKQ